jgi:hypothetical protein
MTPTGPGQKPGANDRKARLAEELRANLARRKAQARSRKAVGLGDDSSEAEEQHVTTQIRRDRP